MTLRLRDKSAQTRAANLFFSVSYGTLKPMRSFLYYSVLILLFSAQAVSAQEVVRVRAGEHDGYSRLVFDWKERVPYSVKAPSSRELVIEFEKNAQIKSSPPKTNTALNIDGFKILSKSPLRVSITIPDGARTRNFWAGDRVVLDVYDPPSGKRVKQAAAKPVAVKKRAKPPKIAPKKEPEKTKKTAAQDKDPHENKAHHESVPSAKAVPVEPVEVGHVNTPPVSELAEVSTEGHPVDDGHAAQKKAKQNKAGSNLIMLSATKSQGLAVFELNGDLWIVNDQPDLRINPGVKGPKADMLSPLQTTDIIGGKVFKTKMLEGYHLRGQGGGLLWRVIISPNKHKTIPTEPMKVGLDGHKVRSGKIIWPFDEPGKILDVEDPTSGAMIKVVTVENSKLLAGPAKDFVDFETLNSPVGLAIIPKVDDLQVRITSKGVEISRPGGLALLADERLQKMAKLHVNKPDSHHTEKQGGDKKGAFTNRIYDLKNWQMGGVEALGENGVILLSELHGMTDGERIESLVTLAKMHISNAQGAEALGYLRFAQAELPDLSHSPEFIALRGAAKALDWKSEQAFSDLSAKSLESFEEIGYWRAFVLADLGDWAQAQQVLPKNFAALYEYSDLVFNRLALVVAEVALRSGNIQQADKLLHTIEEHKKELFEPQIAALSYLKGEAARQRGKIPETKTYWKPLTTGTDDLYRAKAGLALTRLRVDQKEITPKKAIDKLERLRYAWRGDLLEAQINYWLGKTYFEAENYAKGLTIMREAASVAGSGTFSKQIAAEMKDMFAKLFLSDDLKKVTPPDAAALYQQFSELSPTGDAGDKVVEMLADHLMKADLLERAASLLSHQLDHRLEGSEAHRIAVHLAAIYLLDDHPKKAAKALGRATSELQKLPEEMQTEEKYLEISLLRARALSGRKRADQALALLSDLPQSQEVNRLRADIAWNANYWDDAAEAINDVMIDNNFSLTRPLNDENAALILRRAVALNLSGDRVALANLREKYTDMMAQTEKARVFDVISRPRQSATLASRETLLGVVSEVDLFADFMNSYREKSISTEADDAKSMKN